MSTKTIEAIILSRRDFGEADRLLTAYSREEGKVKILAKGSRKLKSKLAAHVEPFTNGKYFVAEGRSFYILAGVDATELYQENLEDLDLYKSASYVCELLEMVTYENQKEEILFETTKKILLALPSLDSAKREVVLRFFEYVLLDSIGYSGDYVLCKKCHKKLPSQTNYRGNFEGFWCEKCQENSKDIFQETIKIMRIFKEKDFSKVLSIKNLESYNESLKELILPYLYDIIPRTPKSRQL